MVRQKEVRRTGKRGKLDQNKGDYFNDNKLKWFYSFVSEEEPEIFTRSLIYMLVI